MGIPDHLTFLLRNLYAGQEATVRTGHSPTEWFQIGKVACQGCLLSSCLFNLFRAHHEKRWAGWSTSLNKIAGRNINNLRYEDDTTLMAESEGELKKLLMKVKEESEKVDLKLNIQKPKIMPSGPITSWQIDGETVEKVTDFIFLGSKITADGDCNPEIKRCLLLGRKAMANVDSILKSRDFANKVPSSQSYGFSSIHVWMWELDYEESWAPKNWCFWTVVLETTLQSPLGCKEIEPVHPKGNQSSIFIERTDAKAETLIFWPSDTKTWLIWKDPDAGKDWGQEKKGMREDEMVGWHHRLNGYEFG